MDEQSRGPEFIGKERGRSLRHRGKPIGVAEITKKRSNVRGAVGMGHAGSAKDADSQFYITLRNAQRDLDGKYTVFGRVISGMDVALKIQRTDVLKKAYVKE